MTDETAVLWLSRKPTIQQALLGYKSTNPWTQNLYVVISFCTSSVKHCTFGRLKSHSIQTSNNPLPESDFALHPGKGRHFNTLRALPKRDCRKSYVAAPLTLATPSQICDCSQGEKMWTGSVLLVKPAKQNFHRGFIACSPWDDKAEECVYEEGDLAVPQEATTIVPSQTLAVGSIQCGQVIHNKPDSSCSYHIPA